MKDLSDDMRAGTLSTLCVEFASQVSTSHQSHAIYSCKGETKKRRKGEKELRLRLVGFTHKIFARVLEVVDGDRNLGGSNHSLCATAQCGKDSEG